MIQPADAVRHIQTLDGQHGREDLRFGNSSRVACKERLDMERFAGIDEKVHLVAGNIDTGYPVDDLFDLRDHDAVAEAGRFDDGGRVFRIGSGVEIAVEIRDQRDLRRQVH